MNKRVEFPLERIRVSSEFKKNREKYQVCELLGLASRSFEQIPNLTERFKI